jgi:hypothetical protein
MKSSVRFQTPWLPKPNRDSDETANFDINGNFYFRLPYRKTYPPPTSSVKSQYGFEHSRVLSS